MTGILEDLRSRDDLLAEAWPRLSSEEVMVRAMTLVALRFAAKPASWRVLPDAVEAVKRTLGDESPRVRALGAACLGVAAPGWSDELAAALDDPVRKVRAAAAEALLTSHRKRAAKLLASRLPAMDEDDRVATLAMGLTHKVVELAPAAADALFDSSSRVRQASANLLRLAIDGAHAPAIAALSRGLRDAEDAVRLAAMMSLSHNAHHVPSAVFVQALADSAVGVRAQAAAALGRSGGADACAALVPLIADPERLVRQEALSSLVALGCPDGSPAILERASDVFELDHVEFAELVSALADLGGATEELLKTASHHSSALVRAAAMSAWSRLNTAALPAILCDKLATDPDARVRAAAATALTSAADDDTQQALLKALLGGDPEAIVRRAAAVALRPLRTSAIARAQVPGLRDSSCEVRAEVARNFRGNDDHVLDELLIRFEADETNSAVRAEIHAARRAHAIAASAEQPLRALFDPSKAGDAYSTWLLDLDYYPVSEHVVFYCHGVLEVVDIDDTLLVYTFETDGRLLRLTQSGSSPQSLAFSISTFVHERFPYPSIHGHMLTLKRDPWFGREKALSLFCPIAR